MKNRKFIEKIKIEKKEEKKCPNVQYRNNISIVFENGLQRSLVKELDEHKPLEFLCFDRSGQMCSKCCHTFCSASLVVSLAMRVTGEEGERSEERSWICVSSKEGNGSPK
ncbi:hypothetical protein EUGRSUZ_D02021 [Eucalyptus grandis]|uniref:Uncharacterized protein n=2 Tax=Eucalyptus grandis TaxID=71139 RepID=A0ACC3L6T7_EUCGR|nr:hypothetical protein EUGRSUZ_D02021 [Eucalyptus grandis]